MPKWGSFFDAHFFSQWRPLCCAIVRAKQCSQWRAQWAAVLGANGYPYVVTDYSTNWCSHLAADEATVWATLISPYRAAVIPTYRTALW